MSEPLSFADRLSAIDLVNRFFFLVDMGRAADTAALFAADGTLTFGPGSPKPGTVEAPGIAAAMTARQAMTHVTTRHVLSGQTATPQADGSVLVYSLLTLFRSEDESRDTVPASVADIEDVLVRDGDGWRIRSRTVLPVFNRA